MSTLSPTRPSLAPYESYPLQDMLKRAVQRDGSKTAVIDGDRTFTFRELDDLSDKFASALAAEGVSKGYHIGLLAPNCVEFVVAFYGIIKAGAVATTINSGYREREIAHQLNDSRASSNPVSDGQPQRGPGRSAILLWNDRSFQGGHAYSPQPYFQRSPAQRPQRTRCDSPR